MLVDGESKFSMPEPARSLELVASLPGAFIET